VDPRSVTALLPSIAFAGNETLLLCIQGSGLRFDASSKGFADDRKAEDFIAKGDFTEFLRVSGSYEDVTTFVNSESGLRVWSSNGAIAGKVLSLSVVALSGPSIDRDFCDQGLFPGLGPRDEHEEGWGTAQLGLRTWAPSQCCLTIALKTKFGHHPGSPGTFRE
jgi:hypothetical protein